MDPFEIKPPQLKDENRVRLYYLFLRVQIDDLPNVEQVAIKGR